MENPNKIKHSTTHPKLKNHTNSLLIIKVTKLDNSVIVTCSSVSLEWLCFLNCRIVEFSVQNVALLYLQLL